MKSLKTAQSIAYFVAFIAVGLTTASLGPTLPGLAAQTSVDVRAISYLFTARSLGFLLGSFRGGQLYDRLRGHTVMAGMIAAMAMMMALVPLATKLWLLFAVMLALGAAEGLMDVGGNTLLVWVHQSRVAPFMTGLHFFYGVGACLSPFLIAPTLNLDNGLAISYWMLGALTLPSMALLLCLPSPQNLPAAPAIIDSQTAEHPPDRTDDGVAFLVVLIALLLGLYVGAEVSYGSWIFSYVESMKLGDGAAGAYLTSGFWGALTVGRLLGIPLAARVRPGVILFADLLGCFVSVTIAIIWPASLTAICVATIGLGLAMASIYPTALTLAGRRMKITGKVTGLLVVGGSAGGMFLPWLIGQLFERHGAEVMLLVILVDLLLAAVVLLLLIRHSGKEPSS